MNREQPKPDEVWQHFKRTRYIIIQVASYSSSVYQGNNFVLYARDLSPILKELAEYSTFIAQNTETDDLYEVNHLKGDEWFLKYVTSITDRKPVAWARPLDNFMEILSSPEASNYYRFERVS